MKTATVRQVISSTGNFDFTSSGFGTVDMALVWAAVPGDARWSAGVWFNSSVLDAGSPHGSFAHGARAVDNESDSLTNSVVEEDVVIALPDGSFSPDDAAITGTVTDGVRLSKTFSGTIEVVMLLIQGVANAYVDVDRFANASSKVVSGVGFTPTHAIAMGANTSIGSSEEGASLSWGMATKSPAATYSYGYLSLNGEAVSDAYGYVANATLQKGYSRFNGSLEVSTTVSSWDATGITLASSTTDANWYFGLALFELDAGEKWELYGGTETGQDSAPVEWGTNFEPVGCVLLHMPSSRATIGLGSAASFNAWLVDDGDDVGLMAMFDQDGSTTTNTNSKTEINGLPITGYDNDGSPATGKYEVNGISRSATGFTLTDFEAATTTETFMWMAIGEAADAPNVFKGATQITKVYHGATEVTKVYKGSTEI